MVMWQEIMNNNIQVRTVLCKSIAWIGLAEKVKVVEGWWKYFSNMCKAHSQYSILTYYFQMLHFILCILQSNLDPKRLDAYYTTVPVIYGINRINLFLCFPQLPNDTIIQIWQGDMGDVQRAIDMGYHALYSTCWYLDLIEYGTKWPKYYMCDPADTSMGKSGAKDRQAHNKEMKWVAV